MKCPDVCVEDLIMHPLGHTKKNASGWVKWVRLKTLFSFLHNYFSKMDFIFLLKKK